MKVMVASTAWREMNSIDDALDEEEEEEEEEEEDVDVDDAVEPLRSDVFGEEVTCGRVRHRVESNVRCQLSDL